MVIAKGTQISKPVMKYFFKAISARMAQVTAGFAAGVLGAGVAGVSEAAGVLYVATPLSVGADFEAGLSLMSVAYQPLPLSWNPAAVTCF